MPKSSVNEPDGGPRSIPAVLKQAVSTHADAPAVVAGSGSLTYADLDRWADSAAGALWGLGVRPGDRIAACLPNDLDVLIAFHGAQRIGAVWAGIGEALTGHEQAALIEVLDPRVILSGPAGKVDGTAVKDLEGWRKLVAAGDRAPAIDVNPLAPAGIAFSSGTTGEPKALVHSQHNLLLPAQVLAATRGWDSRLRKGDSFPFTILNMLVLSTLAATYARGCCIVIDRRDVRGVAEWIEREQVTVWNGAPAQLFDMARHPDLDLRSLTEVWTGGGDCPEHIRQEFAATHRLTVTSTYGLSEAPTVISIDPITGDHQGGASGQVLPHVDVAAYDAQRRRLTPGATGEIGVSTAAAGPWAGQWRPPLGHWSEGELRPLPPGPLMTGDIGSVSADGWLTVIDRKKLTIVRGGANVYPAEVEAALLKHPSIAAAAVLGVPDDRLGEKVAALVVSTNGHVTSSDLHAHCAASLARYKVPEVWGQVTSLPLNGMGKIIRTQLPRLLHDAARI